MAKKLICIPINLMDENVYIYWNDKTGDGVIIDPGAEPERIAKAAAGINVKAILLTHGHFDHIGGAERLREILGANIYACEKERMLLSSASMNGLMLYANQPIGLTTDVYTNDGETLDFGGITLKAIHTPGHTAGSMCFFDEDEGILFSGDTLFLNSIGNTSFPTGDYDTLIKSIQTKLFSLPDSTAVYPGHGGHTTIGWERQHNPFFNGGGNLDGDWT